MVRLIVEHPTPRWHIGQGGEGHREVEHCRDRSPLDDAGALEEDWSGFEGQFNPSGDRICSLATGSQGDCHRVGVNRQGIARNRCTSIWSGLANLTAVELIFSNHRKRNGQ